jgi:hypothetical protein
MASPRFALPASCLLLALTGGSTSGAGSQKHENSGAPLLSSAA